MGGEKKPLGSASLAARTAADGVGAREWLEMGGEKKPLGTREWLEMGGDKKPLGMSEVGCADGCGRSLRSLSAKFRFVYVQKTRLDS